MKAAVLHEVGGVPRSGELAFEVEQVPLSGIEGAWRRTDLRGRRLVVIP